MPRARRIAAHAAMAVAAWIVAAAPGRAAADDAALVEQGRVIFDIGGCASCHSAKDGPALAGGEPLVTPFGTFHPPNITPDPKTGIGGWSLEEFGRAMRDGIGREGEPLYPAFPYVSYTLLSDEDIAALKAYLDTMPPVEQASPAHALNFPYNIRTGLWAWRWLFFTPGRFVADPGRDAAWNRGAYLVDGPGHCQECHTPRNFAGALDRSRAFAGGDIGGEGGRVPNISGDVERGIGAWSAEELTMALTLGMLPDGDFVGGEMAKVVEHGTSKLPEADLAAVVQYLKSLPPR